MTIKFIARPYYTEILFLFFWIILFIFSIVNRNVGYISEINVGYIIFGALLNIYNVINMPGKLRKGQEMLAIIFRISSIVVIFLYIAIIIFYTYYSDLNNLIIEN